MPLRLFGTKPAHTSILSPLTLRGQVVQSKSKSPSAHLSEIRVSLIRRANTKLPILNTNLTITRQTSFSQITPGNRVKAVQAQLLISKKCQNIIPKTVVAV
jgi:hypothetical protein